MPTTMTIRFRVVGLAVAAVALAVGWVIAARQPVPTVELDVTTWVNGAPDWSAQLLWPVMQLGSLVGPALVGSIVYGWRRSAMLAGCVVAAGLAAWFAAKAIKATVERGRPLEYLADITVREGSGVGFGFVSGHTAVAFAWATVVAPEVSVRARVGLFALAAAVGLARIVHGVHLPADVLGGAGVGVACAIAVRAVAERLAPPPRDQPEG